MELRRLRLLLELSRRGTLAAVADALAYSPSSVSVQLAELEREVGVKLLRRVGRNVQLTPAGWRLAEHAEQALAADEAILTELAGLGGTPRGRVRVTFVQTPALALLPRALAHAGARGARPPGRGVPARDARRRWRSCARARRRGARHRLRPGAGRRATATWTGRT